MPHFCNIIIEDVIDKYINKSGKYSEWKNKWIKFSLISESHPRSRIFFKSRRAILNEKMRHLRTGYTYIIHPLSKCRQIYTIYRLFFYTALVFISPLDATVNKKYTTHKYLSLVFDLLSIIDIIATFLTGYIKPKSKTIELNPSKIARRYIFGPFFILDTLSAMRMFFYFAGTKNRSFWGFIKIICLVRSIRIWTVLKLIYDISLFLRIKSKTTIFTICSLVLFVFTLNFFTCFLIASKVIIRYNFDALDPITSTGINVADVYFDYMHKSSAYLLGINLPPEYYKEMEYVEDYVITIFTYLIGKLLLISTWLIIALSILSNKSTQIKFQRILAEVNEYMINKQLPLNLRKHVISFYKFRYQESYFKEDLIQFLLPENLRKDINMAICKYFVNNVAIFKYLTKEQISEVVELLTSEIFLPNDFIFQSGAVADCMYFIVSGTVAVYSHSGLELCHLGDGDYFGEVSLVLKKQNRPATVSAIETSHLYKLSKSDFKRTLMKHKKVYTHILRLAEIRLKNTVALEERYKKTLLQMSLTE